MAENLADYRYSTPIPIRFSDIDAFGNVSNTIYLTYFEIARQAYWKEIIQWDMGKSGVILGKAEINYLKPLTITHQIKCYIRTSRIGNSSFDVMHVLVKVTEHGEEICTTGKSLCVSYDYTAKKPIGIPTAERQRMIEYDEPGLITNTN
ncbi:acyl-CoA thioesterase [Mucilaginibacter myungsuensis]|uniref:Acyl-CoA thioesterase n=1 Tax=Mucilaginibacter myungsuensis TaxID=649104 RepID=A0A929KZH3_9SPHI|nr:thioesterase family protein [Mucilaginibacter myungsuensis]MBE9664569.1 acyl-CoA thioesterase [Mucilaginibacter myungsuensis]MDN3601081.1 thioesterase family protein [Mucilaginibacter myungsuensis]